MLDWMGENEPTAETDNGVRFDIEQAGENLFWAFKNDRPVGTYETLAEAKARCENLDTTDLVSTLRQQALDLAAEVDDLKAEIVRLRGMAYQPADKHKPGCDCIQCVPF